MIKEISTQYCKQPVLSVCALILLHIFNELWSVLLKSKIWNIYVDEYKSEKNVKPVASALLKRVTKFVLAAVLVIYVLSKDTSWKLLGDIILRMFFVLIFHFIFKFHDGEDIIIQSLKRKEKSGRLYSFGT